MDCFAGIGPWGFSFGEGDQMGECDFCGLEGHGHAVSGEGGDDGMGVAERENSGHGFLEAESEACDGGERAFLPFRIPDPLC